MAEWFAENIGTIVIAMSLIIAAAFAVRSIIVRKKKGQCSCGCDCGTCAMSGKCHSKQ
ncbi:MAG: FeoB-associated Cys-rich membrane protein [Lachnospiraceae bacterium]|nr:FeoB-associated Cys-rich membrane protein [Lachnospiraceae bacterium]